MKPSPPKNPAPMRLVKAMDQELRFEKSSAKDWLVESVMNLAKLMGLDLGNL